MMSSGDGVVEEESNSMCVVCRDPGKGWDQSSLGVYIKMLLSVCVEKSGRWTKKSYLDAHTEYHLGPFVRLMMVNSLQSTLPENLEFISV